MRSDAFATSLTRSITTCQAKVQRWNPFLYWRRGGGWLGKRVFGVGVKVSCNKLIDELSQIDVLQGFGRNKVVSRDGLWGLGRR